MKNNALEELKAWADKYNIGFNCWESNWTYLVCFAFDNADDILLFSKEGNFIGTE